MIRMAILPVAITGGLLFAASVPAGQESAPGGLFEDAARVDSLLRRSRFFALTSRAVLYGIL